MSVSAPMASSTAVIIKHDIARRYRGGHHKTFLPITVQSNINDVNSWQTGFVSSTTTNFKAFVSAIVGATPPGNTITGLVNVSFYNGFTVVTTPSGRAKNKPTLRTTPLVEAILSSECDPIIGSQRRRLA